MINSKSGDATGKNSGPTLFKLYVNDLSVYSMYTDKNIRTLVRFFEFINNNVKFCLKVESAEN
jgi:hypothetical protein